MYAFVLPNLIVQNIYGTSESLSLHFVTFDHLVFLVRLYRT